MYIETESNMPDNNDLYSELKPEMEKLVSPLFDASEVFINKRGAFLPHGAILTSSGEVQIVNFAPEGFESRKVNAPEILPGLHEALRQAVKSVDAIALGVAEDVTITPQGEKRTKAIKVLFEHRKGLVVALYLPWRRKLLGGIEIGSPISLNTNAEVCAWKNHNTSKLK